MKIKLPNEEFKYITENSSECDNETAFVLTNQNEKYLQDAKNNSAHSIINIKDVARLFGIDKIKIVGITGTNGKTTTASAIYSFLLDLGYKTAMQGTRGFFMNDDIVEGKSLTTPSVLNTYRHIYQAVEAGCEFFIMEVSSHAIAQKRIEGLNFELKILTNITQDHLDYHKTIGEYIATKNSFFQDDCKKLINKDEPKASFNFKNTMTYAIENSATYRLIAYSLNNASSGIIQHFQEVVPFTASLHGFFNLYNLMAAISAVHMLTGKKLEEVAEVVDNFAGVSGRMEQVCSLPNVIVDFAHTPDGMQQVLNALKEKELLVVFGAGGDRDRSKRPMMGRVAASLAKKVYVTSDNPRNEDPQAIVEDILEGIEDKSIVSVELNRKKAIQMALDDQEEDEVVVILGKGDESYQIIYDEKLPFDDREVVKELLNIN
ncbi:MAG: UDP-N-acetylmuramoyl-L-alanyl-D-glutamate--2,6-diaminopimelate ligase [Sulfurimonas sp.]|uniref:UDP-N-acetylmuramoyl-L-alanyl-D-glutamate--2, 6-diaminopimelate ligase n=1 Tax=Sulfurimonas sp. TaxID=2022749 RepID=UPI002620A29F|nr:UDP-N-acetylmuramoyl-L-alanyl-D-glutamate--2,6-diaminopimelate ligase [Sulfurimonas sp.]MCW8894754.1 UDP-N-acetylmuramoyl-L-alanyl-D-glutamate--2,6-diaminopimelate ligase [Sulfurimonas sp.]MCW8954339.1 UDP-N-acetylmuramoyl-L-alanyl-D-glutamate--2,6-diaminopimelate ligase [Sulfurimonas sp.]MCW9067533.1 UDP-N-acetylmuramoyl-L-alanyl-D-glutamate--2,6-diaminopimelate ligase [Sulfurimonas sp.]